MVAMAQYKGRSYRLLWSGPTKFGRRAKLGFMDGSKDFWVDESLVISTGGGRDSSGNSIGSGASYRAGVTAPHGRTCPMCGSRECSRAWDSRDLCSDGRPADFDAGQHRLEADAVAEAMAWLGRLAPRDRAMASALVREWHVYEADDSGDIISEIATGRPTLAVGAGRRRGQLADLVELQSSRRRERYADERDEDLWLED